MDISGWQCCNIVLKIGPDLLIQPIELRTNLSLVQFHLKTGNIKKFGKKNRKYSQLNRWNWKPGRFDRFSAVLFTEQNFHGLLGFLTRKAQVFLLYLVKSQIWDKRRFGENLICVWGGVRSTIRKWLENISNLFGLGKEWGLRINCRTGLRGERGI